MMKWFRVYTEIIDDPKLKNVSDRSFRVMIFLFSLAAEADEDGLIPLTEDEIMWRLRIPEKVLAAAVSELSERNIINDSYPLCVLHWSKRQYKSDNVNERVKRYRNVTRNVAEPLHETAPEQIQNRTDTEQNKKKENTKKEKPTKKQFLEVVFLTDREHETLITKYGREPTEKAITILNNAIQSKGYKYKSHYHTILGWPMEEARKNGNGKLKPATYAQAQDAEKRAMFRAYNESKEQNYGNEENNSAGNHPIAGRLPDPSQVR